MITQTTSSDYKIDTIDNAFIVLIPSQMKIDAYFVNKLWFELLVKKWKNETRFFSFSNDITKSESYKLIINMGKVALPFIFQELKKEPAHWFVALKQITKENPVKETSKGNIVKMVNDWLLWGKTKKII
ncbi:MAG: hypothetical protein HY738_16755 [Bacteroidia bacterium]|nr:hypothetical protein [Bacteroidia bacterium]